MNEKLKKHVSKGLSYLEAVAGIYFTKKWRAESAQPGLEFDKSKPRLESVIFECIFRLNGSSFRGDAKGFLKGRIKTYLMAQMLPLNLPTFFSLHIYSLWGQSLRGNEKQTYAHHVCVSVCLRAR